jgi:putative PIN family toxin of toxin-antitoxin system
MGLKAFLATSQTRFLPDPILTELSRTFAKPYFDSRLTAEEAAAALLLLRRQAEIVPITAEVSGVATHPADDVLLATAVSANAEYLVTGDGPLIRRVPEFRGVRLISPRDFLTSLQSQGCGTA